MRVARKCSYCGNFGHNSRTCSNSLSQEQFNFYSSSYLATKRSFRKNYLLPLESSLSISSSSSTLFASNENSDSYLGNAHISTIRSSKKGMPWTEEEHRIFLRGLEKLGKGNWRGISRDFVTTKTPTQVASHAQKHFLRQSHSQNSFVNKRKHHLSLLNVGCEKSGISNLTANDISCISQLSGSRNFLPQWLSNPQYSMLKWFNPSTSTSTSQSATPDLELKLATPHAIIEKRALILNPHAQRIQIHRCLK
uniref:MYB family transcription factor n=1 Tax=Melilotus albus TaxID=47082 RepID=A0A896WBJ5_MELAB|nr:MYB family transcription factor [Melilotus albus]